MVAIVSFRLVSFFFRNVYTSNHQLSETCGSSDYSIGLWVTHNVSSESYPQCFGPCYGPKYLSNEYIFPGRLHELNDNIPVFRHVVTTSPRASPMRILYIRALASALAERFLLLRQVDDLEQSILHHTEAVFLPPHWDRRCSNIAQNLFCTANLLILRAARTVQSDTIQPEDVKHPVIYLRYLYGQSPEAFNISPNMVKENLVYALALQVKLELGDLMQDIEEMVVIFLELVNSDLWTISTGTVSFFAEVLSLRVGKWGRGKEPPVKVIDCLRKAKICLPGSDELSITLAWTLLDRFRISYSNDDYDEGTAIVDEFLTSHAHEDEPSQYLEALQIIFTFAQVRLQASWKPEHLVEVIHRLQNFLPWIPLEDPSRPVYIDLLTALRSIHFKEFGVGGLQEEHTYDPMFSCMSSLWKSTSPSMATEIQRLCALSPFHMTDMAEIEKSIETCRLLIASHTSDLSRSIAVYVLAMLLLRAFLFENNIEYINEAISILREGSSLPITERFGIIPLLIASLGLRFSLCGFREDLDEIMQLHQIACDHRGIKIPDRFNVACEWAQIARTYGHPSTSTAYHYALSSMQDSLTFAPTVDIQHSRLVAMRNHYETLPLECASYQVCTGQLQSAVETLERGRALIWSEMRGLRSSIDQLRASDSDLADKFATINQDLEVLTLTFAQNNYDDGGEEDLEGMDPFGRLVVRQQRLLDDRDNLISQIRARKGLESFLKPPSFDSLRFAAVLGPVIMINHCSSRSDIIILLYDSPPSLIPTADDFYDRANKLRDQLLGARKEDLDSVEYEDALRSVLKELYELVGRPVIQRLHELDVPEQSRVWWCPTSAFCSLPLHAMGPIPSDSDHPRYFLDMYIPSYTPTLSALIESNRSGSHILGKPSLLLVAQQDGSMEAALGEVRVVQSANTQVKTLILARATPPAVLKRLQDHRFVHIICHGILEPGKPFDSSFKLYGGNRLTLLDIIRSRLPNAEFAFLAACHTAELTDGSLSDESLHLTAAMQYCGFRSVVGTMWAMADKDGPHLARNFYNSVFPPGEGQGACYYERTAEALRDAVVKLRGRTGEGTTLERWVNFVHYGA